MQWALFIVCICAEEEGVTRFVWFRFLATPFSRDGRILQCCWPLFNRFHGVIRNYY